ncbi:serine/threonine protein kinase [Bacillus sp. AFS002410]|uniref:protein kinase domain-containing protein n=1 Tax=Bacillus sp. AFS002410 TaxID=2033481 RepID=UPI000BF02D64|nr:protein kinase [Bacillus sp. AFS002410]PEJ59861.1 serine/threonine protein kinase [Bacillus sp. AFS002410]
MMNNQLNGQISLAPGTLITGKWNNNQYEIKSLLGNGANGTVYLASGKNGNVALKLSKDSTNITNEVNVLKKITQVQDTFLGPSFIDVDDYVDSVSRECYYFYVMEYVNGVSLPKFIERNGIEWSSIFIIQVLSLLDKLHHKGYIFGDLKTDNLLVTKEPNRIQWIDFGGVTQIGRAVKEFTEFFDRGYWGLGTRKAEISYDLFAVTMIFIHLHCKKQFLKNGQGIKQIEQVIDQTQALTPYKEFLMRGLKGEYVSANAMKQALLMYEQKINATKKKNKAQQATAAQNNSVNQTRQSKQQNQAANQSRHSKKHNQAANQTTQSKNQNQMPNQSTQSRSANSVYVKKKKKRSHWFETSTILLLMGLAYVLYFYYQL